MKSRSSCVFVPRSVAFALFVAASAGGVGTGCAPQPAVVSTGPRFPSPAPAGSIEGPFVQAGMLFSIRMDAPVNTSDVERGTPIVGTVVNPLYDNQGRVAVPYGAKIYGAVEAIGSAERPRLRFHIERVDTVEGIVPVQASVRSAQHLETEGPPQVIPESTSWDADTELSSRGNALAGGWPNQFAQATGAPFYGEVVRQPREVFIPQNALVELLLVRPILLPGARATTPAR